MTAHWNGFATSSSRSRMQWMAVALSLVTACASPPPTQTPAPVAVIEAPIRPSDFTIPAGELETWNAIGQLLVRMPGVTYQGRSQKLGLYAVDYQGESFLILARGLVASEEVRTLTTGVRVALQDGSTDHSDAATELLASLQAQLPAELIRIAALPKPKPASTTAVAKKRAEKSSARH